MKNKRILVDVDGVVADLIGDTIDLIKRVRKDPANTKFSDLKYENLYEFYFLDPKYNIINEETSNFIKEVWSEKYFALVISLIDGAIEGIKELQKLGEVYFVTSPWEPSATWCHDRTEWLKMNFGVDAGHVIFAGHKEMIKGDVLIDDCPKYIRQWGDENGREKVVVFDHPWNRREELNTSPRAHNWKEVVECVKKILKN